MVFPNFGRSASFDAFFSFEVRPEDGAGNLRVDTEGDFDNEIAIFPDAVENFQGLFIVQLDAESIDINPEIYDFQFDVDEISGNRTASISDPVTLDLVARVSETTSSIEYSFVGGELNALGIYEVSIILEDADFNVTNGFQVVLDRNDRYIRDSSEEPGFQFSGMEGELITLNSLVDEDPETISRDDQIIAEEELTIFQIDPDLAVNDIRYITGEDDRLLVSPLILANQSRVSGPSASDPSLLVTNTGSIQSISDIALIEAEDLTLDVDGNYQVRPDPIGSEENSFKVIELRDRDITGTASFTVGSDLVNISDRLLRDESNSAFLTISTFDENDGVGEIQVLVNDRIIPIDDDGESGRDFITLNETESDPESPMYSPANHFPNEDIRQEFTFELDTIQAGDEITIRGTSNNTEFVRLDFITLEVEVGSFPEGLSG